MLLKSDSAKVWLGLGYQLFSEEGHEGLQVERLARILGRNKSAFYHFFGDKETYLEKLMEVHLNKEGLLASELVSLKNFNPGFLTLMVKNKEEIMFQTHLVKNRNLKLFMDTYTEVNKRIEKIAIQLWVEYTGVSPEVATKYWRVIRDSFYARITSESFNEEWLSKFVEEAKAIIVEVRKSTSPK